MTDLTSNKKNLSFHEENTFTDCLVNKSGEIAPLKIQQTGNWEQIISLENL